MKEASIIETITDSSVKFTITQDDEILNLSLEQFIEELKKKFANKAESFLLNF